MGSSTAALFNTAGNRIVFKVCCCGLRRLLHFGACLPWAMCLKQVEPFTVACAETRNIYCFAGPVPGVDHLNPIECYPLWLGRIHNQYWVPPEKRWPPLHTVGPRPAARSAQHQPLWIPPNHLRRTRWYSSRRHWKPDDNQISLFMPNISTVYIFLPGAGNSVQYLLQVGHTGIPWTSH